MFDLQKTEHEGTCPMPNIEFDRLLRSLTTRSASNKLLESQTMETVAKAEKNLPRHYPLHAKIKGLITACETL